MPGVIRLTTTRSVPHNAVKEKTIVDLMKKSNNKVNLMKKLLNLKMVEGTPVA